MSSQQRMITAITFITLIVISLISFSQGKYEIDIRIIANWIYSKFGFTTNILWSQEQELILNKVRLRECKLNSV